MAYIEENLKLRRGGQNKDDDGKSKPYDPKEELYKLPEQYKTQNLRAPEEGNVMNSISMLAAIPEVDLGMEYVLSLMAHFPNSLITPSSARG